MRYPELYYRWEWQLRSSPEQLWPFVADTNRFNQDVGLQAVETTNEPTQGNARRRLRFFQFGVRMEWDEEPFEWMRPRRFGVRRKYRAGPIASLRVLVKLVPQAQGGTNLVYETWLRPRNLLGLVTFPILMRFVTRRAFGAAFRKYDELAMSADGLPYRPEAVRLAPGGRDRLAKLRRQLAEQTGEAELVDRLVKVIKQGDDFTLARLRPYALADAWGVARHKVLEMCLQATRVGLLDLQWDLLCPLCRGAKESASTLAEMKQQVHCDVCNIDFNANFERSVELTFRVSSVIRKVDTNSYCVGGPQVTPHIVAQQLLAAGDQRDMELPLEAGRYRLRTLTLPGSQFLAASPGGLQRATVTASERGWPEDELVVSLAPSLRLENGSDDEQLFVLERTAWSDEAATAAEVITLQAFRDLFSKELLRPHEQVSVGNLTILFTDLRASTRLYQEIGDAPAFGQVMDHFGVLREEIAKEEGTLVKTIGDAIMATFRRPVAGLRAILSAQQRLASSPAGRPPLYLKAGLHHGPCIAVTLNDRLDFFGSVVNTAARLERLSSGEDVVISDAIRQDPEVEELLLAPHSQLVLEPFEAQLKGFENTQFQLWRVSRLPLPPPAEPSAARASNET